MNYVCINYPLSSNQSTAIKLNIHVQADSCLLFLNIRFYEEKQGFKNQYFYV